MKEQWIVTNLCHEGVPAYVGRSGEQLVAARLKLANMRGLKMLVQRRVACPLFNKSKVGWIVVILRELITNAAVLIASRHDQLDQRLACLFDLVRFRSEEHTSELQS